MVARSRILHFAGAFALVYGLLIAPWPGWNAAYARGLRVLCGRSRWARTTRSSIVRFRAASKGKPLDTEIVIVVIHAGWTQREAGRALVLGLDSRGVGWVPTALLAALVLATLRRGAAAWVVRSSWGSCSSMFTSS